MSGPLSGFTDLVTDIVEATGYTGIGVLMLLTNVVPPVPAELIPLLAGFVAGEGLLWLPAVVVAATAGSVAGALVLYFLGYRLGQRRLRRFIRRFGWLLLLSESDLDRANDWFERHGRTAVLFGRMVPGVRKAIPIPAGVVRMPLASFVACTTIGNGLLNSLLATLGWVLGDRWRAVRPYAHLLEYGVMVSIAVAIVWFVGKRWRSRRDWFRGTSGSR